MLDDPFKRTTLDPAIKPAISALFARARKGKGILSLILPSRQPPGASIAQILERHDPQLVSRLSRDIRSVTENEWYAAFGPRHAWGPHHNLSLVGTVLSLDSDAAYLLMTTWSGHVRERAVSRVRSVPGPFALALLAHRMNDWVPQVASAARRAFDMHTPGLTVETIADCAEYLQDFDRAGRADAEARQCVAALLARGDVVDLLRKSALGQRADTALRTFTRLVRTSALDADLPMVAVGHPHPRVRALATRAVLTGMHRWRAPDGNRERAVLVEADRDKLARTALADRAAAVRLAGLAYVADHAQSWPDRTEVLLAFAGDSRASLADAARFGLITAGIDWVARLRERLVRDGIANPDIARALGRFGTPADGERLQAIAAALCDAKAIPFLAGAAEQKCDPAIARLSGLAIGHSETALARRAARALREAGIYLPVDDLKAIADRGTEFFARGLAAHLKGASALAQFNVIARLERTKADGETSALYAQAVRKFCRGGFNIGDADRLALKEVLADAPKLSRALEPLLKL